MLDPVLGNDVPLKRFVDGLFPLGVLLFDEVFWVAFVFLLLPLIFSENHVLISVELGSLRKS